MSLCRRPCKHRRPAAIVGTVPRGLADDGRLHSLTPRPLSSPLKQISATSYLQSVWPSLNVPGAAIGLLFLFALLVFIVSICFMRDHFLGSCTVDIQMRHPPQLTRSTPSYPSLPPHLTAPMMTWQGMTESAGVASCIFLAHMLTLCILVVTGVAYAISNTAQFVDNINAPFPEIDIAFAQQQGTVITALFYGYSSVRTYPTPMSQQPDGGGPQALESASLTESSTIPLTGPRIASTTSRISSQTECHNLLPLRHVIRPCWA